jgi:hypothetical protein
MMKTLLMLMVLALIVVYMISVNGAREGFEEEEIREETKLELKTEENIKVADAFEDELHRMPDRKELAYFAEKIKRGEMDEDGLKVLLQSTPEARRYNKLQTNVVNADVLEKDTDRQVKTVIEEAYMEVHGKRPSPETIAYLREVYPRLGSKKRLEEYLKALENTINKTSKQDDAKWEEYYAGKEGENWAPVKAKRRERKRRGDCGEYNSTLLSDEIDRRNTDELYSACKRNAQGEDMMLLEDRKHLEEVEAYYRYRAPVCVPFDGTACSVSPSLDQTALIGTLLTEAKKTNVGSLLSGFKYEEDVDKKMKK